MNNEKRGNVGIVPSSIGNEELKLVILKIIIVL